MTTPFGPILSQWEAEGYRHSTVFDSCAGAVVIGEDPSAAAEVALGIARVQARRRRVAVADTVGELAPLEDLVPMDAPYGLIDSFFYGVSLNKVAYVVDPARNLIIFPSGAVPIDHEALLSSDRWAKLLDGFRAAEGLLLIVAPAESSALSTLIQATDGVVLVGNVAAAPGTRVLAHARVPVAAPAAAPGSAVSSPTGEVASATPSADEQDETGMPRRPSFHDWGGIAAVADEGESRPALEGAGATERPGGARSVRDEFSPIVHGEPHRKDGYSENVPPWARVEEITGPSVPAIGSAKSITFWVAIVFGAFLAAAILTWITTSMMSRNNRADAFAAPDSTHAAAHVLAAPAPTALSPGATAATPRIDTTVSAPAGSDGAATPYAVVLADIPSITGANSEIDMASRLGFPVATFAPYVRPDGHLSYVVIAGASADSASGDSLLRAVRAKRYRNAKAAHLVRLPYAVVIQKGVSQEQATLIVRAYVAKGLPVYPLLQADGSTTLYAGAFRGIEQAQPLLTSFKANGDQPTVVIRTGRPY